MRGTIGLLVGLAVIALGLASLGVALTNLMITAQPESALIPVGGIAVFAVSCLLIVLIAYRS